MEIFTLRNVSFSYPEQRDRVLGGIDLSVQKGEFLVLCGPSGCGKSTLLRQLKSSLAPHGVLTGEILFENQPLPQVDTRTQSARIGFVLQSPDNQIVTDKVWHELAFGLESLGFDTPTIRRRVAEMASFFGIQTWFYKNVNELSGGQKQLLSLASIMAMQPSVLILDEPTSQLDPIAASDFLAVLGKINRELGTTIILTEHRLEEAFPLATRAVVMDEGKLLCSGTPQEVGCFLKGCGHGMFLAMPTAMRVWAGLDTDLACPVTVREGSDFLTAFAETTDLQPVPEERIPACGEDVLLTAENIWFRYERDLPDVVKGVELTLHKGELLTILGGNGTGKSTTLKVLAGLRKPYRGSVTAHGSIGVLPQNPQALFVKKTVREDLYEILPGSKKQKHEKDDLVAHVVSLCGLTELLDRHPYDLSGGEQQRAALAKVLLMQPDILLMDEPTKGFDAEFKQTFAQILNTLLAQGIGIFLISHDIEFCAEHAHRCALFFDGNIVTIGSPRVFFSGNSFYTTSANRMARHLLPEAVTAADVLSACGGRVPESQALPEAMPLPEPKQETPDWKPTPLPLWRKLLAVVSGLVAVLVAIQATTKTDLTKLVSKSGITALATDQLWYYAAFIAALLIAVFAIGRRSAPPVLEQQPREKRKLTKRTLLATVMILLCIPLTLFAGVYYLKDRSYNIIALLVLFECMLPFFLVFEGRKPKARELVIIAVLCAIGVAGRAAFFMLPQFKPVLALSIIAGVSFGGETGFLVGALTMLASNVFFSQGPWAPWQMFSAGIIGFLAGVLFRKGLLRRSRGSLAVFGAIVSIVIYGGIMNASSVLTWNSGALTWKVVLSYYVTGFPMDCIHAFATVLFLLVAAEPMLEKLDRIKTKYGLIE